tara:strand:- start:189 stop:689 length:501 start_codon:yes stop_codon:yes gene_type:complete
VRRRPRSARRAQRGGATANKIKQLIEQNHGNPQDAIIDILTDEYSDVDDIVISWRRIQHRYYDLAALLLKDTNSSVGLTNREVYDHLRKIVKDNKIDTRFVNVSPQTVREVVEIMAKNIYNEALHHKRNDKQFSLKIQDINDKRGIRRLFDDQMQARGQFPSDLYS